MKKIFVKANLLLALALVSLFVLGGCNAIGESVDPGAWGYDCKVMYNALGGQVGNRELRTTYYMSNSYIFKPVGTSGMLIQPTRDGYLLAGWYTDCAEAAEGAVEEYAFEAQNRWDFSVDRIQEDGTLYARWIPQGRVSYINADTNEIIFTKNISEGSTVTELSLAVLTMYLDTGDVQYFADAACTTPYDFSVFQFVDPNPTEKWLYDRLYEKFPQYLESYEFVAPAEEEETILDTSWNFLNKAGYQLTEAGLAALDELKAAKNQLVEENIQHYLTNTADQKVYVKVAG